MTAEPLKSPFPYFGGKRKVAETVWQRFGMVQNYVEPFFGSGAVLLGCPYSDPVTETVNDADGLLANFWRALQAQPEMVAKWADWPVNENDLHARHAWLVEHKETLQSRLEGDPDFYDAKVAGWWVWGMACWIGSGFCSGNGPWKVREIDGVRQLVDTGEQGGAWRKRVHVGSEGQGVNRQLVHLMNAGYSLNRNEDLIHYFTALAARLRRVRVCCGDWSRVCGPSVTYRHGITAVFLDPPYADTASRTSNLYRVDCEKVAHDAREWAIAEGKNPLMRIALCGYAEEHTMPAEWECFSWSAGAGFGGQAHGEQTGNGKRERVWFSPHCERPNQGSLF
jgi:hypothetical protein